MKIDEFFPFLYRLEKRKNIAKLLFHAHLGEKNVEGKEKQIV